MSDTNDREVMLDKLNAAFDRAIEAEEPEAGSFAPVEEPEAPAYEHVSHDVGGLYGDDARAHAGGGDDDAPLDDDYDDDDDWDDEKPAKKKGKAGLVIGIILGVLVVLLLAGATLIAEPWVKAPADSYTAPTEYTAAPDKTIAVGDTYSFDDIGLGGNEAVSKVEVADSDILGTDGVSSVTGAGEYFTTKVNITTSEKEIIPLTTTKDFSLFGKDLSGPYNKIRSKLRSLLGVEKAGSERTELRVLGMYEQNITVKGLEGVTTAGDAVEASTSSSSDDVAVTLAANEDMVIACADDSVKVTAEESSAKRTVYTFASGDDELIELKLDRDGDDISFFVNGKKSGASVNVLVAKGFWKSVDADTYAAYLAATGKTAPELDDDATDEEKAAAHINEIFVPTSATSYAVKVA